jgi:quinol monooxygenase YgiN
LYGGIAKLVARPGRKAELLEFLSWDAQVTRTSEPGTLRFDVWESSDEPDVVYLYEAYVDRAAFDRHMANDPFKQFVDHIVPTVIEPPTFVVPFSQSFASNADC